MLKKLVIFVLLIFYKNSIAQKGEYFVKNYLPNDYHSSANNFAACQDDAGRMFFANQSGILIFDGFHWNLEQSKDEQTVSALYKSSKNIIYYAVEETNDFGIFEQTNKGDFTYKSLLNKLKLKEQPNQPIKQIVEHEGAIYFLSADRIIEYKNERFKVYKPKNRFHIRSLKMGKHLFFIDLKNNMFFLNNGTLLPVKSTQELSFSKAWFSYKINAINYAIGFRNIGIYIAKYDSINPANTIFEKKVVTADNELIESEINNGFHLKNGKFVITSNKKGAYIINKNLEITERLNNKSGLFENNIKAAYEDKNGNLWLPNYYGISYVEINSSLLKYSRETGISGSVQASCYYNNNLYIGTDKGLQIYDLKTQAFTDVLNFNKQTWFLLNYSNLLFVCTLDGIYIFNGKEIKQISEESTNYLLNDPYQTNIVYAATDKGANVYHLFGSELSLIKSHDLGNEVKSIASDKNKNIYFSTPSNGIYYLNYQNSYLIDSLQKKRGLPNDKHENFVFNYNNNLLIGTDDGIYSVYKGRQNKLFCKKDSIFYRSTKNAEVYRASNLGRDLLCSKKNKLEDADKYEYNYSFYKILGNKLIEDNASLIKLKDVKPNLISYDTLNKVALISADEGLFIFNPQNNNIHKTYNLFLSSLINNKSDTLAVHQIYSADFKDCKMNVPFYKNKLEFKFGYNCFENPENVLFNYFLEGRDKDYGKWEKKSEIDYSNLFEGNYVLHVKAKNDIVDSVIEMHIPFSISAPWYRTFTAYIIYGCLFTLFLFSIVKLNTKRLKVQNLKLEGIIKQRTFIIEQQVNLLEHQKQEITDSISYAQRIQQSILPSIKEMQETFSNGFIFFQPKDIVSGDFYWLKSINDSEFLVACADCTGHGVPGAFMSMICSEKLTESALQYTEPSKILFHTNNAIKNVLKQNHVEENKVKDGMEISLVRYNKNTKSLSYAGANRPLWIIKNKTKMLVEIKPTKASIASFTIYDFEYEQNDVVLESNDTFYLTSDGFPDQFGGPNGRKFMTKNMKSFLVEIVDYPIEEQKGLVADKINSWKGELDQVDDLLVIGFKA